MVKRIFLASVVVCLILVMGCVPTSEKSSTTPAPEGDYSGDCTDQVDNDHDGITDCEDPGCASQADCLQNIGDNGNLVDNTDGNNTGTGDNSGSDNNTGVNTGGNTGDDNTGGNTGGNTGPCTYPQAHSSLQLGSVAPAYSWNDVYDASGNAVDFSLEDFYCNTEKLAVIVVVVAEWCPNCPGYVEYVDESAATLVDMGAEILYVSAQNMSHELSDHSEAQSYINGYIGNGPGLRVGDGATQPTSGGIYSSPSISGIPTAFVIQRSDMKVISDQGQDQYMLQFTNILQGLGGTSDIPTTPATDNCGDGDEESYEPNDTSVEAGVIQSAVSFTGGVCGADFDFYEIDIVGDWKLDVTFTHSLGDLDIVIWDEDTSAFLREGQYYAGSTSADDNESYEGSGKMTLAVIGYDGATAPYTLTVTDL